MGKGLNELLGIANPGLKAPALRPGSTCMAITQVGVALPLVRPQRRCVEMCELVPEPTPMGRNEGTQVLITVQTKPRPVSFHSGTTEMVGPATAESWTRDRGYNRVWTEHGGCRTTRRSRERCLEKFDNAPKLERCNLGVLHRPAPSSQRRMPFMYYEWGWRAG